MAKFKGGDMITGLLTMSDGTQELVCFMVNRVYVETNGQDIYSLDDGDGFIDSRASVKLIDSTFSLCNDFPQNPGIYSY